MAEKIIFKRGDTFILSCVVATDITGWTIASQIRDGDTLIADLTFALLSTSAESSTYTLTYSVTTAWPLHDLNCDIQYTTAAGQIISTETFTIGVVKDTTR